MLGISACADLGTDQQPKEIGVFAEEGQPSTAVGGEAEIRGSGMPLRHLQLLITDDDRRLAFGISGKSEMKGGVDAFGVVGLKIQLHAAQESIDRGEAKAVPHRPCDLVGKPVGDVRFGVRTGNDLTVSFFS